MIIWGSRGLKKVVSAGRFHCPRCGPDKPYDQIAVNRWFTLYFIPVIPLGAAGHYIECKACAGTFDTQVKNYDPDVAQAEFQAKLDSAVARTALVLLAAGGDVGDTALRHLAELMETHMRRIVEPYRLGEILLDAQARKLTAKSILTPIAHSLSNQGKTLVLQILRACVDGEFSPAQRKIFDEAGVTLGFRRKDLEPFLTPAPQTA
ncbi:zinc-ribbon domain-containing protein [Asticcacaulis solisilvae]|uniref:zinc-ribbon domain-containing protein n=1 Tax=Asticcacaulis solisilvae TaxID=1217274 RepID=UPI003FD6FD22